MKTLVLSSLALTLAAPLGAQCEDSKATTVSGQRTEMTIVETAVAAGSFETLTAALQATGLDKALSGEGPFTVFAPTDEAFAKLPKGTVESLLKEKDQRTLKAILTYHVVNGRVNAKQAVKLPYASSLNGQRLGIAVDEGTVRIAGSRVVKTDIECSNGVIHVIDAVMMPSVQDIVDTAVAAGDFKTLATAVTTAGLAEALKGEGPFTVFAPTDAAFAKLPAETIQSLLQPENRERLVSILTYHVVSGRVYADQALKAGEAKTLQGQSLRIGKAEGGAKVNDANILKTDIQTSNGVIHVIDAVLLPQ